MIRLGPIAFSVIFITCEFCGWESKWLGRHTWRCKEKLKNTENSNTKSSNLNRTSRNTLSLAIDGSTNASNCSEVKCCCGKHCNGLRGLKMHQRSFRIVKSMTSETFEVLEQSNFTDTGQDLESVDWDSLPNIKAGVKLPKSDDQWKLANAYFAASMPISDIDKTNVELIIETMNSAIYSYFRENCGLLDDSSSTLITKYKDISKSALKSSIESLKMSNALLAEIKYVAKYLRFKLQPTLIQHWEVRTMACKFRRTFGDTPGGFPKPNFQPLL